MATSLTYEMVQERIHAAQADVERHKAQIAAANKRIDDLHGEIGDLLAAGRVLARLDGITAQNETAANPLGSNDDFDPNTDSGNPYKLGTNKALMWNALNQAESAWLTANQIQEIATKLRGSEIPMSSVSPGLSDMKQDGTIERDGMRVALRSRLKENGAPDGAPDAGEVAASPNNNQTDPIQDLLG